MIDFWRLYTKDGRLFALPPGEYALTEPIVLPRGVSLRGSSTEGALSGEDQ